MSGVLSISSHISQVVTKLTTEIPIWFSACKRKKRSKEEEIDKKKLRLYKAE